MNVGAIIALLKLAQDAGITEAMKPIARKITLPVPLLTYEQGLEIGGPSRLGLRPKGL